MTTKGRRWAERHTIEVNGVHMDNEALAEHCGISKNTAASRMRSFRNGRMKYSSVIAIGIQSQGGMDKAKVQNRGNAEWQSLSNE